jgi:hypothetical protein
MYDMLQYLYVSVRAVHRHIDKMYQNVSIWCILQDVYYKLCMLIFAYTYTRILYTYFTYVYTNSGIFRMYDM